ncbi:MAG: hypothetical protein LBM16_02000, partial [Clostridiales bacterium]|nr:hypothetical protein [Clostridiales bacterium]
MGKKSNIAGIIDIGSNSIRLKIGQNKKGELVVLETASFPLLLGRDTFAEGKVNFEKAAKACDIIKNFRKLCTEYGADTIRVTAGASIREASNRSYILDQIYLKTGLSVELNDNQDEKLYIYKLMHMLLPENYKQSSLLVYSGSGNAGVALVKEGKIPYIQTIRTGSLRLSEMFGEVHEYSNEFSLLVEEYLKSFTDYISLDKSAKNFIACGNEMILISELTGAVKNGNFLVIEKSAFDALYANIKSKSVKIIAEEYNISEETAELLLPAMAVYGNLISFTRAEQILSPHVYFIDAVLYETLFPEVFAKIDSVIYESASIAARTTAIRFGCSEKHFSSVEGFAIAIFDKMKKLHGLSQKHKVILS